MPKHFNTITQSEDTIIAKISTRHRSPTVLLRGELSRTNGRIKWVDVRNWFEARRVEFLPRILNYSKYRYGYGDTEYLCNFVCL